MAILLNNDGFWHDQWRAAIEKYMPNREIIEYPDVISPEAIDYALVWKHPHGDLLNYPNLKAVFSLGSGVDHLDGDQNLPDVPIFRLITVMTASCSRTKHTSDYSPSGCRELGAHDKSFRSQDRARLGSRGL